MKAPEMPTILTIGHSTRTWKAFLDLLRAHRVKRVIDVRSIPRSRHNPQFNQVTLRTKLRSARIGYVLSLVKTSCALNTFRISNIKEQKLACAGQDVML